MGWKGVKKFQLQKHTGDDGLSRLPDDILVGILSTLTLKEAARTSILSSRWENIWKQTLHLNFDDDTALCRIVRHRKNPEILTKERRKYKNWVNKVIRSYEWSALKELRICFDLNKSSAQHAINRWLQFAFKRRVERLELDLSKEGDRGREHNAYALPTEKFRPHQPGSLFESLKYLKALCLRSVDVTDQDVEAILRSCPLLENLAIDYATKLSNVNICDALALKHLEIRLCNHLKSLKVSAPNLISLKVSNAEALLLENVPKLVDVNVFSSNERVLILVHTFYCCLSQLEVLTWKLTLNEVLMEKYRNCKFPALPKLKKLEIQYYGRGDESMIGLTCLIRAAPYLQEFVIKLRWYKLLRTHKHDVMDDIHSPNRHQKLGCFKQLFRTRKNVKNDYIHSPHQHLKVVKFLGYYGRSSDVELVRYLVDNCVVLETLVVDPRYQPRYPHAAAFPEEIDGLVVDAELPEGYQPVVVYPDMFDGLDAVITSRKYAKKQLQGKIPQHIELVIL